MRIMGNMGKCSASKILFSDESHNIHLKSRQEKSYASSTNPPHSGNFITQNYNHSTVRNKATSIQNDKVPTNFTINMKKKNESQNVRCQHSSEFLHFKNKKNNIVNSNKGVKKAMTPNLYSSTSPNNTKNNSPNLMNSMFVTNPCYSPQSMGDQELGD